MKDYTLIAFGKRIKVDEMTYKTYYQAYEKERYQNKQSLAHTLSLARLEKSGFNPETHLRFKEKSTEESLEAKRREKILHAALNTLEKGARERFLALAYGETTERSLAETYGMSKSAVHREKQKSAKILRKYLEDTL